MRIKGARLYKGVDSVVKNLKPGWYPFGNYQEPKAENNWQWQTEEQRKSEVALCTLLLRKLFVDGLEKGISMGKPSSARGEGLKITLTLTLTLALTITITKVSMDRMRMVKALAGWRGLFLLLVW